MSETFTKLIEAQEKEITSLKEEVVILKTEVASLGKALDTKSVEVVEEGETCAIHGVKGCANLKCIPTEVEVE